MLLMVTLSIRLSFNRLLLRTNQNACMIQIITYNALIFPAEPLLSGQPILSCGHPTIPVGDRLIQVWPIHLSRHHNIFINILQLVQYGYGLIRLKKNIFIIDIALTFTSDTWVWGLTKVFCENLRGPRWVLWRVERAAKVYIRLRKRAKFAFFRNILSLPQSWWQLEGFCFQYPWKPSIIPVSCS